MNWSGLPAGTKRWIATWRSSPDEKLNILLKRNQTFVLKGDMFPPETLCAVSRKSPSQFMGFYSTLKLRGRRSTETVHFFEVSFASKLTGFEPSLASGDLQRLFSAQVVSSLCGGWALGLSFVEWSELFKYKAEWMNISTAGRGLWEVCVWVRMELFWVCCRFGFTEMNPWDVFEKLNCT